MSSDRPPVSRKAGLCHSTAFRQGRSCGRDVTALTCNQMVEQRSDADIDRVFHALPDATRRDIVRRTLVAEQSVSELAAAYAMSFAAVSKHIAVLAEARLITKRAEGRVRLVSAADPPLWRRLKRCCAPTKTSGAAASTDSTRSCSKTPGCRHPILSPNPPKTEPTKESSCPSHPSRATPNLSP